MARVISAPTNVPVVAITKHICGAVVEFEHADIKMDDRSEGSYVVCPHCKSTPWISTTTLKWGPRE
jgi:hypothetical protein